MVKRTFRTARIEFVTLSVVLGFGVGLLVVLVGLWLWWPPSGANSKASELGAAVIGAAVVAFAVLLVQVVGDQRQERRADRQRLELTLSLQSDLRDLNLSGRDLSGFVLVRKNLTGANFSRANLRDADFTGSTLTGANFSFADLRGVRLNGSMMDGIRAQDADFSRSQLKDVSLKDTSLSRTKFEHAFFDGADLRGSDFFAANLSHARFTQTDARGANFACALLESADFSESDFSRSHLEGASLKNSILGYKYRYAIFDESFVTSDTELPRGESALTLDMFVVDSRRGSTCKEDHPVLSEGASIFPIPDCQATVIKQSNRLVLKIETGKRLLLAPELRSKVSEAHYRSVTVMLRNADLGEAVFPIDEERTSSRRPGSLPDFSFHFNPPGGSGRVISDQSGPFNLPASELPYEWEFPQHWADAVGVKDVQAFRVDVFSEDTHCSHFFDSTGESVDF